MTEPAINDDLEGWSSIAGHLNVSILTAMRYEKDRGLPITRDPAGHPMTTKTALRDWKWKRQNKMATQ